jgi:hypothetical protein
MNIECIIASHVSRLTTIMKITIDYDKSCEEEKIFTGRFTVTSSYSSDLFPYRSSILAAVLIDILYMSVTVGVDGLLQLLTTLIFFSFLLLEVSHRADIL